MRARLVSGLKRSLKSRSRRKSRWARIFRRRGQVVPVITWGRRRRWLQAAEDDWAGQLHRLYLRERDEYIPRFLKRVKSSTAAPKGLTRLWRWYVLEIPVQSSRMLRTNGRLIRETAGVSLRKQAWELLWLSITLPTRPEDYYKYELYRPENRARAGDYLHSYENSPVFCTILSDLGDPEGIAPLGDKVAFAKKAERAGLRTVPTLAVIQNGNVIEAVPELPQEDLFAKPLDGTHGRRAQKWFYQAEADAYQLANGKAQVTRYDLLEHLAAQSTNRSMLVQPCLRNHPDLSEIALDAVVTCRVVTMTNVQGDPEPVIATFRMPAVRGAFVDNMHRGGLAAPVDIDTGLLGAASDYATDGAGTRHEMHPVTGVPIAGRKLPDWDRVLDTVRRAHRCFSPRIIVGWDINISPDGPVIVEGNEYPGVGGLQRLHNQPLGSHRFGQLLVHHLIDRRGGRKDG